MNGDLQTKIDHMKNYGLDTPDKVQRLQEAAKSEGQDPAMVAATVTKNPLHQLDQKTPQTQQPTNAAVTPQTSASGPMKPATGGATPNVIQASNPPQAAPQAASISAQDAQATKQPVVQTAPQFSPNGATITPALNPDGSQMHNPDGTPRYVQSNTSFSDTMDRNLGLPAGTWAATKDPSARKAMLEQGRDMSPAAVHDRVSNDPNSVRLADPRDTQIMNPNGAGTIVDAPDGTREIWEHGKLVGMSHGGAARGTQTGAIVNGKVDKSAQGISDPNDPRFKGFGSTPDGVQPPPAAPSAPNPANQPPAGQQPPQVQPAANQTTVQSGGAGTPTTKPVSNANEAGQAVGQNLTDAATATGQTAVDVATGAVNFGRGVFGMGAVDPSKPAPAPAAGVGPLAMPANGADLVPPQQNSGTLKTDSGLTFNNPPVSADAGSVAVNGVDQGDSRSGTVNLKNGIAVSEQKTPLDPLGNTPPQSISSTDLKEQSPSEKLAAWRKGSGVEAPTDAYAKGSSGLTTPEGHDPRNPIAQIPFPEKRTSENMGDWNATEAQAERQLVTSQRADDEAQKKSGLDYKAAYDKAYDSWRTQHIPLTKDGSNDQNYDFDTAHQEGAKPDESGHWPADYRLENHPLYGKDQPAQQAASQPEVQINPKQPAAPQPQVQTQQAKPKEEEEKSNEPS